MSLFKKNKKSAEAIARQEERDRKHKEFHESTMFTDEEKQVCDIIVKSDFSKCEFKKFYKSLGDGYSLTYETQYYHKIIYNNIKLYYFFCSNKDIVHSFDLCRVDNGHSLKTITMGRAKIAIIDKLINDKLTAYIENSITSALHNKSANAEDCPYCGTKNASDKTNCINCGAVIKTMN